MPPTQQSNVTPASAANSVVPRIEEMPVRVQFAIRLADDALVHGQRLCEWSSRAPWLEEDLALANVALDYLGRARELYAWAAAQIGSDEDVLAFRRDDREFRNLLIVELPRGDFAFTMLRQYLVDVFELRYFQALGESAEAHIAAVADKTVKEVRYHVRRSTQWVRRLGLGTDESRRRAQAAVDELWGYVDELFAMDELETRLAGDGVAADREPLRAVWQHEVETLLTECELVLPTDGWRVIGGRSGVHTEHLGHLLAEMQSLQRAHPGLSW